MHLNVYTEILHQIFFNELERAETTLKKLNLRDKKSFLSFISFSRIEHFFIKKFEFKNIELIFGSEEACWLTCAGLWLDYSATCPAMWSWKV